MDIGSLSSQSLNQAYNPFASSSVEAANVIYSGASFEELLKKTQNAAATQNTAPLAMTTKTPIDKNSELYQMCMELETFLIKNLIKSMRSTVQKTGLIDTGFAGEMYEDMLYDEYAKTFARNANLGFAEMAYRDLARYM